MTQHDMTAVVALLKERDPRALTHLMELAPRIEIVLARKFGTRIAPDDLRDIVADAIVLAFARGASFDPARAKLITWLNILAHYQAVQFLRANPPGDPHDADAAEVPVPGPDVDLAPEVQAVPSPAVAAALDRLPRRQARAVAMRYYEDQSYTVIARELGVSEATARSLVHRGCRALRRFLGGTPG